MDLSVLAPPPDSIYRTTVRTDGSCIVIDNGSCMCRAGYAVDDTPHLQFRNLVYKHRLKKNSVLVGNDIPDLETVRNSIRSAFDKNIITQYEIQEHVFDHIFSRLGISDDCVNHPIIISEPLSNPWLCRQQMTELLFECYGVPKLAYTVDALASFYQQSCHIEDKIPDGLILSLGYHTVSLIPVLDGRLRAGHCMRINIGGCSIDWYMQRLMQLKYPCHAARFTLTMAEKCVHELCSVPMDYKEIEKWRSPEYKVTNTVIVNLPYAKTEVKLSEEQVRRKREQQIVKLKEARQKRQVEKLKKETSSLDKLVGLREIIQNGRSASFRPKNKTDLKNHIKKCFKDAGLKDNESLEKRIVHIRKSIRRLESQISGRPERGCDEDNEDSKIQESATTKEPNYMDVPDDELTSEERKIKRRQAMLRAAALRREQIRSFKEEQRKKLLKAVEELEEKRGDDFLAWITSLRYKRLAVLDARQSRKNRKVSDNERKVIQQQRIRLMTEFQQGKLNLDQSRLEIEEVDEEESSDSEAEHEQITQLETLLAQYDPDFSKELGGDGLKVDIGEYYRFHLTSERTRVPELLFHPSLVGCEQAGLVECAQHVFSCFSPEEQQRLAGRVFLTGGPALLPGLQARVEMELRQIRPFQSPLEVVVAKNPILDAWRGARSFALSPHFQQACITREMYDEMGHDYLVENMLSNVYLSSE